MEAKDYKSRWPELLRDLTDKSEEILKQAGVDAILASDAAHRLADAMRHDWGGQLIYFPKGDALDLSDRDIEFYGRWNGTTEHLAELCMEYDISLQWGYKIIKAVRALDKSQRELF